MGASASHMTDIHNQTDSRLELRKCTEFDREGLTSSVIVVQPHTIEPINSRRFFTNWSYTSTPRFIKFYCNEVMFYTVSPGNFSANRAFIVEMNGQNITFATPIPRTPTIRRSIVTMPESIPDRTEEPLLSGGSGLRFFCLC
ncbi:unnamed protein product [Trifolium pratense]|uniref:Uncharacterized protein n=1 Tax=Trifolium pratense TaxID=57577 RepID=A0ACB0M164_TRIPR|nr:unnamed protein product [Trifolium pratense]